MLLLNSGDRTAAQIPNKSSGSNTMTSTVAVRPSECICRSIGITGIATLAANSSGLSTLARQAGQVNFGGASLLTVSARLQVGQITVIDFTIPPQIYFPSG